MRFRSFLRLSAFVAICLLGVGSRRAQAATFTVTNTADSGTGSLREAITNANYSYDVDDIVFSPEVSGTLTLNSLIVSVYGVNIIGPGADKLTISGNSSSHLLSVYQGYVSISGLTFANSSGNSGDSGTALSNANGIVTLTDCILSGNHSTYGGAIDNRNGMIINNCSFTGNIAGFNYGTGLGGAIYNEGKMTVSHSSFSNNQAPFQVIYSDNQSFGVGLGGAIMNTRIGNLTLSDCTFAGNKVSSQGGAIYNEGKMTLSDSALSGGLSYGAGGGLYNTGTSILNHITFSKNTTLSSSGAGGAGGAIYNMGNLSARSCTYTGNSARRGGALFNTFSDLYASGSLNLQNNTFKDNQAQGYNRASTSGCTGQSCSYFSPGQGGAIYNESGTVTLTNATFVNNSVTGQRTLDYNASVDKRSGGALFNATDGKLFLLNDTFSGNADKSSNTDAASRIGTIANLGTLSSRNSVFVDGSSLPFSGLSDPTSGGDTNKNFSFATNEAAGLSLLANNGGPVATMALKTNSPLLDVGVVEDVPPTDARGAARPQGPGVDVGAYEQGTGTIGPLFSIMGKVTVTGSDTTIVPSVSISLTNSRRNRVATTVSDLNGSWTLDYLPTGTYTVTPSKPGYRFSPTSQTVTLTDADQTVNFSATPPTESLVVTTLKDEDDGTSDVSFGVGTSLREALNFANTNYSQKTISFKTGLKGTITLGGTPLTAKLPVTIIGPGANVLGVSGGNHSTVFINGTTADISKLTIKGGGDSGIINRGALSLTNCILSGNSGSSGGGLYSTGSAIVNNCTFSANTANVGGALYSSQLTTIANSTFTGNLAQVGGAIYNFSYGTMRVSDSTVARNQATQGQGGGIYSGTNGSTTYGTFSLVNSIVAGNKAVASPDISSGKFNANYNLIQDPSGAEFVGTGNLTGIAPLLTALASNGGQTPTMAPMPGSPAIDAGQSDLNTDQRSFPRPVGKAADIGAYEVQDTTGSGILTVGDISVTEGDNGTKNATFTVTLSRPSANAASVKVATASSSGSNAANVGVDYEALPSTTLMFAPGQTTQTFNVTIKGDRLHEGDEVFVVKLSGATDAKIGDSMGICTIVDNDPAPILSVSAQMASVVEGNVGDAPPAALLFTVKLSSASGEAVKVRVDTAPGLSNPATSGVDYGAIHTTLLIPAGQLSQTVSVPVKGDTLDEANERVALELTSPVNATLNSKAVDGKLRAEATIVDDDEAPSLSINDVSLAEGNGGEGTETTNATFTLTLSQKSGQEVNVDFATASGTAVSGSDFVGQKGSLTIAPGQTKVTLTIAVKGDTKVEDDETFTVKLSHAVGATLDKTIGTATITNDDQADTAAPAENSTRSAGNS